MNPAMGWGDSTGVRRKGSTGNFQRAKRRSGAPVAIAVLLLVVVGTCLLLLHRLSNAKEDKGLHVVTPGEQQGAAGERAELSQLAAAGLGGGSGGSSAETQQQAAADGGGEGAGEAAAAAAAATVQQKDADAKPMSKFAKALQKQREEAAAQLAAEGGGGTAEGQQAPRIKQRFANYFPTKPDPPVVELSAMEVTRRRDAVKAAMLHAWRGYEAHAWGFDELCPVSQKGKNDFGGLGATIIDSLDTLYMLGLHEEYARAAKWVLNEMPLEADFDASVFETIIRVVGGLVAAHDLTGDKAMLQRAQQVADRLLPAYDTPTGIPYNMINLKTLSAKNPTWNQRASTLAEFGTHQLEFYRLSQGTGNGTYAELAEATIRHLHRLAPDLGLMPLFISPRTGNFTARRVSFGALGDSYYEYLLKMWIVKGKSDEMYRSMWEKAMDEMIDKLVFVSKDNLTYIAEFERVGIKHKFDHLVCFVPGMLGLGAHSGAVTGAKAERYMALAGELTHTCWQMYHRMPSGLSPEYVTFNQQGLRVGATYNLLRPEALEAMWYMWRLTHDWRYRTWAWEVFQAFETHCKAAAGYSGLKDVRAAEPVQDDTMQSFFLAETLKYLYLIFSDDDALDMDEWVLNTEAHPLRATKPAAAQQQAQQEHKRFWWTPARAVADGSASVARRR